MHQFEFKHIPDTITARELQVLQLSITEKFTCKEISESLNISEETVKRHRKNILKKFQMTGKHAFRKLLRTLKQKSSESTLHAGNMHTLPPNHP